MRSSALLAPWEYTGDLPEVLCDGEFSFEGAQVRFELLGPHSERRLVFRRGEDDGSWTTHPAPAALSPPDARYTGEDVQKALKSGSFRRHFFFDFGEVELLSDGTGYWPNYDNWPDHYSFSTHQSIASMSSSRTRNWLLALLEDTASEASFTLRFSQSPIHRKRQMIFGFDSPEQLARARTQLDRLCRLVLCSDVELWKRESRIYWGLHAADNSRPTRFWLRSFTSSKKLTDPYLQRWAAALGLAGPLVVRLQYACIGEFMRHDPLLASGELTAPTYHEQLEARLELRDWGRAHLPSEAWAEIERLEF